MEEIEHKQGWKKKLKWVWDEMKLNSMDFSGWNYLTTERKAKEHEKEDYMKAFGFRGIANKEGVFHVVANTYFDEELSDGIWDTENNLNKLIKVIDKHMKERDILFIELDSETWNLEEHGDNPILIKIFKSKITCSSSGEIK